jgi:hypothetical protein
LLGARFTNLPTAILTDINKFIAACEARFDLRAVYLEMNGFDINYDRWYFDFFGYAELPDDDEHLDWLSDWQSEHWPEVTLTGLEIAQNEFKVYDKKRLWKNKDLERSKEIAVLLVMTRFVMLVESAVRSGPLAKDITLLATAHDFDIVGTIVKSKAPEQPQRLKRHDLGRIIDELGSKSSKTVSLALGKVYTRPPEPGARHEELVRRVAKLASTHKAPIVRQMAVMVLPVIGSTMAVARAAVFAALADASPMVRRQGLEAMIRFRSHSDSELTRIEDLGKDPDKDVARWSEIAMRNIRLKSPKM